MRGLVVSGISHPFRQLSQSEGQITHVLLTRSPLEYPRKGLSARLACVKHAASVRPEPGSNSPLKMKNPIQAKKRSTSKTIARTIVRQLKKTTNHNNPHPQKEGTSHHGRQASYKLIR